MNYRVGIIVLLCCFVLGIPVLGTEIPQTSAVSAILVDSDSGRVLYRKNENEQRLIASITKLITALVAVESQKDLNVPVKIKYEWTLAEGSSIYLRSGETLSLQTLLYGLLLNSGNDAALAIAGFCAGDVETFVNWMNQRASDLGMEDTHFANPNGLNDEAHYSTAADMAKLAAACMKNEMIAKIVATKSISLEGRTFTNHNKLLWQYDGCVGMKTGYTQMAGRTLISSAKKEGQTLIVVTLNDPNDWQDHKNLFDYGFETCPVSELCTAGELIRRIPVEGSLLHSVSVQYKDDVNYPLSSDEQLDLDTVIELPEIVKAPVTAGTIAGEITFRVKNEVIGKSYLVYETSVERNAVAANKGIRRLLNFFRNREKTNIVDAFQAMQFCA